jgi:hypothetical protein
VAFIVSLTIDKMILDLTDALDPDELGHTPTVRRGPLQENPQRNITSCLVYENDPSDIDGWLHEQIPDEFELGGSGRYKRRFTVELEVFLTRQKQSRANAKAVFDSVHGKCIHALRRSTRIPGTVDEHGEIVQHCVNGVDKSRMVLSGGDGRWIGRGKIWFTVYTQLP